jgi:protein-S-isoprenylcysteine O-methyltransferase Ste14
LTFRPSAIHAGRYSELLLAGIWIISTGWELVHESQGELVTHGGYARARHQQYTGIFGMTLAFMAHWPTLATLVPWPFVIVMSVRLARREEQDVPEQYPEE